MVLFGLLFANDGIGSIEEAGQVNNNQFGQLRLLDGDSFLNLVQLQEIIYVVMAVVEALKCCLRVVAGEKQQALTTPIQRAGEPLTLGEVGTEHFCLTNLIEKIPVGIKEVQPRYHQQKQKQHNFKNNYL